MEGKNRRHGGPLPVGVSIRAVALQRTSSRSHRERSATNANRRLSAEAKAAAADNLRPGVLDYSPEPMGRLAQAAALRPAPTRLCDGSESGSRDSGLGCPSRSAGAEVAPAPPQDSVD